MLISRHKGWSNSPGCALKAYKQIFGHPVSDFYLTVTQRGLENAQEMMTLVQRLTYTLARQTLTHMVQGQNALTYSTTAVQYLKTYERQQTIHITNMHTLLSHNMRVCSDQCVLTCAQHMHFFFYHQHDSNSL